MKKIERLLNLREESGSILVLVALTLVSLLIFTALAIDGGRVYSEKSKLQKAVDSAVLAGAQGLPTSTDSAKAIANDIFFTKYKYSQSVNFTVTVNGKTIKAVANDVSVPMTFARAIGTDEINIHASATAEIAPLKSASGVAPIAIESGAIQPGSTQLNCDNPGNHHGNCGYLRLGDNKGASDLANAIINGGTYEANTSVDTEPGSMAKPVKDSFQSLIDADSTKPYCQSAATADNSCKRVITIVVIDNWNGCNGQCTRNVVGLAAYWIEKIQGNQIIGQFIKMVSPGDIGEGSGTSIGDWNLYGVKLIE